MINQKKEFLTKRKVVGEALCVGPAEFATFLVQTCKIDLFEGNLLTCQIPNCLVLDEADSTRLDSNIASKVIQELGVSGASDLRENMKSAGMFECIFFIES